MLSGKKTYNNRKILALALILFFGLFVSIGFCACSDTEIKADPSVKGTVAEDDDKGNTVTKTDECADATKLIEYACLAGKIKESEITCENGCKNGVCISPESVIVKLLQEGKDWLFWFYIKNADMLNGILKFLGKQFGK